MLTVLISLLVVVAGLDVIGVAVFEPKADPPLVVDRNGVLTVAITIERVQPIARRDPEILNPRRSVDLFQLAPGAPRHVGRNPSALAGQIQLVCRPVCEGLDHCARVTRHVTRVKMAAGSCLARARDGGAVRLRGSRQSPPERPGAQPKALVSVAPRRDPNPDRGEARRRGLTRIGPPGALEPELPDSTRRVPTRTDQRSPQGCDSVGLPMARGRTKRRRALQTASDKRSAPLRSPCSGQRPGQTQQRSLGPPTRRDVSRGVRHLSRSHPTEILSNCGCLPLREPRASPLEPARRTARRGVVHGQSPRQP
jgi:hypothetical protein